MEDFLIKSILCQIVLFGLYYLFLEREKMHQFNRFFLLFSLAFSLAIPFINIEIYEEITPSLTPVLTTQMLMIPNRVTKESINYFPVILWSFYWIITLILSVRFSSNLYKISKRISTNPKEKFEKATLILVQEKILPHTFLNYIFINQEDYKNRNIEKELYAHELTHAKEKHTIDVLFIEIARLFFWFNPILILYKKAIQLNHEFLADEKVVKSFKNVAFYQNLLLEKASWNNNYNLVSNLNFLVTKKRLIMMTKKTSKNIATLKKLALVPLLSGVIYFTCIKTVAQEKIQITETKKNPIDEKEKRRDAFFADTRFIVYETGIQTKSEIIGKGIVFNKLYKDFTPEDKEEHKPFLFTRDGYKKISPSEKELENFKNSKKYAIWIDGANVKNSNLNKFKPSDIAYFSGSVILKNARSKKHPQPFQYWFYTHDYFDKNEMGKDAEKYAGDKIEIFKKVIRQK